MTPLTGKKYYQDHIAEEKEYVPIFVAYPIRKGERLNDGSTRVAEEDGYLISPHNFLTKEEFAELTKPADDLALPAPRFNLQPEQVAGLVPVKKGDKFTAVTLETGGQELEHTADHDGFLVPYGAAKLYMRNFEFSVYFNDVVKKSHTEADPVVIAMRTGENLTVQGIMIPTSMKLTMADKENVIPAGAILIHGGYALESISNLGYRLGEKESAVIAAANMHKTALDNHEHLKNIWLKKKALKINAENAGL
jgi:hypothetical protein